MKILYAEDNDSVRDVYKTHIENIMPDCLVVECINANQGVEILQRFNFEFDLIISDYSMPGGNGSVLYKEIKKLAPTIPFLLLSAYHPEELKDEMPGFSKQPQNYSLLKPINFQEFENVILKIFNRLEKFQRLDENFRTIGLKLFLRYDAVNTDVFLRLGKDNFVKIINANKPYLREQLLRYKEKGVAHLFIKTQDYDTFSGALIRQQYAIEQKEIPPVRLDGIVISTIESILDEINTIGLTPRGLKLINASYEKMNDIVSNKKIVEVAKKNTQEPDFILEHSYILAYTILSFFKYIPIYGEEMKKQLFCAALLHDTALKDVEFDPQHELIDYSEVGTLENKHNFLLHPFYTVTKLTSTGVKLPVAVTDAILNHHENPYGTGFPSKISPKKLQDHTVIFIMSHFIVNELYRVAFDLQMLKQISTVVPHIFKAGKFGLYVPPLIAFLQDLQDLVPLIKNKS